MVNKKLIPSHINNTIINNINAAQHVDEYGDLKSESLVTRNTGRNKCHNSTNLIVNNKISTRQSMEENGPKTLHRNAKAYNGVTTVK